MSRTLLGKLNSKDHVFRLDKLSTQGTQEEVETLYSVFVVYACQLVFSISSLVIKLTPFCGFFTSYSILIVIGE